MPAIDNAVSLADAGRLIRRAVLPQDGMIDDFGTHHVHHVDGEQTSAKVRVALHVYGVENDISVIMMAMTTTYQAGLILRNISVSPGNGSFGIIS